MGKEGRSQERRKLPRMVREVEKNAVVALGRREREKLRERENILTRGRVLALTNCLSFYLYLLCVMKHKQPQESVS